MNVLRHVSNLRAAQLKLRRPLAARPVLGHEIDPVLGFEKRAGFAADCCAPAMCNCWLANGGLWDEVIETLGVSLGASSLCFVSACLCYLC